MNAYVTSLKESPIQNTNNHTHQLNNIHNYESFNENTYSHYDDY